MSYQSGAGYAGDMLSVDAYCLLAGEATSTLIDVRTQAEWAYVGVPDISTLGKAALFLEWQSFPSMQFTNALSHGFRPCWRLPGLNMERRSCLSVGRAFARATPR